MSYRHSSYRKLKKAKAKSVNEGPGIVSTMARHDTERFRLFHGLRPGSKVRTWGVQRHKCRQCGTRIGWVDCPTGGWWAHDVHPSDDHDAARRAA